MTEVIFELQYTVFNGKIAAGGTGPQRLGENPAVAELLLDVSPT